MITTTVGSTSSQRSGCLLRRRAVHLSCNGASPHHCAAAPASLTSHGLLSCPPHLPRSVLFVGNTVERLNEDYLRILRYFRFHGRISPLVPHEPECIDGIQECATGLQNISGERIRYVFLGCGWSSKQKKGLRFFDPPLCHTAAACTSTVLTGPHRSSSFAM